MPATNIDIEEIINQLDRIVKENHLRNDARGFFPVLYRIVTAKVMEGIGSGYFQDGPRMERLDVVFARRYLDAYAAYESDQSCTAAWQRAFQLGDRYWPIVLQHLLVGINAHIALDLGIAAAQIQQAEPIEELAEDFKRINSILSSLVVEIQNNLATIWPRLTWVLQRTGCIDDKIVDFSMEIVRDDAWEFAKNLHAAPATDWPALIAERDKRVARQVDHILGDRSWVLKMATAVIRLGERGSVSKKIERLGMRDLGQQLIIA